MKVAGPGLGGGAKRIVPGILAELGEPAEVKHLRQQFFSEEKNQKTFPGRFAH